MAEENKNYGYEAAKEGSVESKDRGLFDFLGKKEEEKKPDHEHHHEYHHDHHHQDVAIAGEFEKVKVSEPEPAYVHHEVPKYDEKEEEEEEKKPGLLEKLHRSGSSSSSSSEEEEGEGGEKKKKKKEKKGLKEKILGGHEHKEEEKKAEKHHEDTHVPVSYEEGHPDEKKGFIEKIKGKLPGGHKKEEVSSPPPVAHGHHTEYSETAEVSHHQEAEGKEKKGILEKIKEKLPGYHSKTEEEKEKEEKKSDYH